VVVVAFTLTEVNILIAKPQSNTNSDVEKILFVGWL